MIVIEKVDGEWPEWAIYATGEMRVLAVRMFDRLAAASAGEKVVWDAGWIRRPTVREERQKALENEAELVRLKGENARLLAIVERASRLWTVKNRNLNNDADS